MDRTSHWMGGRLVHGGSERLGPVFNPASGEQTGEVELASPKDVDAAVATAFKAAGEWRKASLALRAGVMFALRERFAARADELARSVTAENGKVLADAAGEIARAVDSIEFAAGVPHLLKGSFSEQAADGIDVHSIRQPVGVVAGITPFNFPIMVPMWMAANAVATGNTFILKPSEKDPTPSLILAEMWKEAGLPDGVFTVLQGDSVTVDALLAHPDVAAVSFVGSTPVARHVYEIGTRNGKRVQALGGAKNHMVVLPDADLDIAADAAVSAAFGAAGERCMAISVAVAVGDIGDSLVDAIAARMSKLTTGDGADAASDIGPLITAAHRDRVASYIAAGEEAGATVVVDGRADRGAALPAKGYFVGPTLLDDVTPSMSVYTDEIFGPVLSIVRADSYEDAVRLINANQFANGSAIFTRDGGSARRFQSEVDVGMVGINVPIPVPVAQFSFGGWKESLFGDLHMYGPEGIAFYTRAKVVTSRWHATSSTVDLQFSSRK